MAMAQLGQPYTPAILPTDGDGAPVVAGVAGTGSLYGPASATVPILTGIALAHLGNGRWGATIAGSALLAAGLYRFVVPTLTYGTTTLTNAGALFTVGAVPPDTRTLRYILTAVYAALGDGLAGSGAGGVNTLADGTKAGTGIDANEWIGSELLLLGPTASLPPTNPLRVDGFAPATGVFTVKPDTTLVGTLDYLLVNRNGAGYAYALVREAVVNAIASVRLRERVAAIVTPALAVGATTLEYPLPDGWRTLDAVAQGDWGRTDHWAEVAPAYWEWDAARRVLRDRDGRLTPGLPLRLAGTIDVPPPATFGAIVPLPWTWVRDAALAEVLLGSNEPADARRVAVLLDRARRTRPRALVG